MKSDFADFSVDYDLGEKKYKMDGMLDNLKKYSISDAERPFVDNPTQYPEGCAQKMFNKLEIDLINNAGNTWAMIRVLMHHRDVVEDMLKRTPKNFVTGSLINFPLERSNLKTLFDAIMVEDRVLFNTIAFTREVIYKIFQEEMPTFNDKLIITKSTEDKLYGSLVDYTLRHLTCSNKFKRQYRFRKPEDVMLTHTSGAKR